MFSRIQWLFYPKLGHSKIKIFVARRSLPHRGTSLHTLLGDSRRRPPLYALQGPNSTHKVFTSSHWPTGQHLVHDQNHPFFSTALPPLLQVPYLSPPQSMLPSSPFTSSLPSHHRHHRPHQQHQLQGFDLGNNYSLFILRCPLQGPARFSYDFGRGSCATPLSNLESCTLDSRWGAIVKPICEKQVFAKPGSKKML